MNISLGGIKGKIVSKADIVAFLLAAYQRYPDMGRLADHYMNIDPSQYGGLGQALATLKDPKLLKFKLWDSPHLYTTLFKGGVFAYLAAEMGLIDKKWKKTAVKVMKGSGAAALTLGGSMGPTSNIENGSSGGSGSWGSN